MAGQKRLLLWSLVALLLSGLAIPWFLWGDDTVVAGLPVWLWWHVGWMIMVSLVFFAFTRLGWGVGVEGGMRDG